MNNKKHIKIKLSMYDGSLLANSMTPLIELFGVMFTSTVQIVPYLPIERSKPKDYGVLTLESVEPRGPHIWGHVCAAMRIHWPDYLIDELDMDNGDWTIRYRGLQIMPATYRILFRICGQCNKMRCAFRNFPHFDDSDLGIQVMAGK